MPRDCKVYLEDILEAAARINSYIKGATRDEIEISYPSLRPEHIDAALAYAYEYGTE